MTAPTPDRIARLDELAREAAELRVRLGHVEAEYVALLAGGQYADRPDLRTDHCTDCGHQTDHRYLRGEWLCVVCGTVTAVPRRSIALVPDTDRQAV